MDELSTVSTSVQYIVVKLGEERFQFVWFVIGLVMLVHLCLFLLVKVIRLPVLYFVDELGVELIMTDAFDPYFAVRL